ncbi:YqeG family HAD IIIA-type phosphatase [Ligilactobacillus sp. WILCCON 0076]|uniref:YqeG family HAD IIIA-type phosphatase n=1 Tax=Ligilactobacillus ubinensis TaxID=2876789 RepID=A0A9X2FJ10_9LACO|nr:YqeG family HAD IIIA-type phosphatase [Ligilactobacillus ubinensis]MCP0886729.1 YqeG family HAD IIIA-type phosphatase [Ligilactobacillus ubinensis]
MFNRFKPTWMIESIYDLTAEDIQAQGIKIILTDLDNTLIAWNNPNGTPKLREWLKKMNEAHIPVVVVSNNNHRRVKKALRTFNLPFVSRAMKPFVRGINTAKRRFELKESEIVLVGDQLITDIAAANNANIRSILVKPLVESDAWNTRINRFFEKIIKQKLIKQNDLKAKWGHSLDD